MIAINYKDPRPIYEQVRDGFKKLILAGMLPPDSKLPSVRDISSELTVNPNTIQRAYRDLENEGFIYSVPGKGSFVAECSELNDRHKKELIKKLSDMARELKQSGVDRKTVLKEINDVYGYEGGRND